MERGVRRTDDCDIDCFKRQQAYREVEDGAIVDAAMRDIIAGKFESQAVHEVMGRRAGSIADYVKVKDLYDAAAMAAIHSGVRT